MFDKAIEQNHNAPSKSENQIFSHFRSIFSCHRILLLVKLRDQNHQNVHFKCHLFHQTEKREMGCRCNILYTSEPEQIQKKDTTWITIMKLPIPQTTGNSSSLNHSRFPRLRCLSFPPTPRLSGNKMYPNSGEWIPKFNIVITTENSLKIFTSR